MYFPQQRFISRKARIYREALLPEEAVGTVEVEVGQRVDIRDKVASGIIPGKHHIIDAAAELRLRNPAKLSELMLVPLNRRVQKDTVLAGKNPERGRRVFAPMSGVVVKVDGGRIIIQEAPDIIDLEAGVRGRVAQVYPGRGVSIEALGAVVQGIWGNGKNAISTMRIEPRGGIANMERESLATDYRSEIVITNQPLTSAELEMAQIRNFGGIIAPSLDASLLNYALTVPFPILLTEGFGKVKMSRAAYTLFQEFDTRQATLDAYLPRRFEPRRPEVVINRPPSDDEQLDSREQASKPLKTGMRVRITREPHVGVTGRVVELPPNPQPLATGIRTKIARIELLAGEYVDVPLANVEFVGG